MKFTKRNIIKAIKKIEDNPELLKGRESLEYDLLHEGKTYPPILVLSEANIIAGGKRLTLIDFNRNTIQAFKYLKELGFHVERKNKYSYYNELKRFLNQTATTNLKVSSYARTIDSLKVKVSFGQGNQAKVPWIAFLDDFNTVQEGIYPVYLYFKEVKTLILAYGLSETKPPKINWSITNPKTISQYFNEENLGVPNRYGNSYVYKVYNSRNLPEKDVMDNDLLDLIVTYKKTSSGLKMEKPNNKFNYKAFYQATKNANLIFSEDIVIRFLSALCTKPFVVLTGLSGSGKTKLAQVFAQWICKDNSQICLTPVGADWTNREPLLGYPNGLAKDEYVLPENNVLKTIIEASINGDQPYFIILDEMNLSHVERYFADFLSAMESTKAIPLHSGTQDWNTVPSEIYLPKNLFIIGTVNIDETTYMFSPKVLDRANVIEFRVNEREMEHYLNNSGFVDIDKINGEGANMAIDFVEISKNKNIIPSESLTNKVLLSFFKELKYANAEFGYRTASEINRFAGVVNQINPAWGSNKIFDAAIMQKLLPKVHGSRRKLEPILKALSKLCLKNPEEIALIETKEELDYELIAIYPQAFEKIHRMYRNLVDNGFTSYAEA